MSADLCWKSAIELAELIRRREVSPVEVMDAVLAQADRLNDRLNAVVTRHDDQSRAAARAAEQAVIRGDELGPLHGVPFSVKDLHVTAGVRTTYGSLLHQDHIPAVDAPIVARLKAAGAIPFGKTNTSEFGLIPLAMSAVFGDAHNPWNLDKNTGGSSGGSASAVATGIGPFATASDGGGSIRIPASFCGVYGIKPHMGRVPRHNYPKGWETLAHDGPITRTVADAALVLDCIAGPDDCDRWTLPDTGESFLDACNHDVTGLKLAWAPTLGGFPVETDVADVCAAAARRFEELGCHVDEINPELADLGRAQQIIVQCEAAAGIGERRQEWEPIMYEPIRGMLPKADTLTYHDLLHAQWSREDYWHEIRKVFAQYDALITPTCSITAPDNGTLGPRTINGEKIRPLSWLGFVVPFNMTWQPAASVPAGFDSAGLPVGLQIVGPRFGESRVFALSAAFERAAPWDHHPTIVR